MQTSVLIRSATNAASIVVDPSMVDTQVMESPAMPPPVTPVESLPTPTVTPTPRCLLESLDKVTPEKLSEPKKIHDSDVPTQTLDSADAEKEFDVLEHEVGTT